jgi:membrane associated rhomboid family serine protease
MLANMQVRGCCCGIPFGCGTVFLLVGCLFLWKLASGAFGGASSAALYAALVVAGAGLVLSVRVGRGRPGPPRPGHRDPL